MLHFWLDCLNSIHFLIMYSLRSHEKVSLTSVPQGFPDVARSIKFSCISKFVEAFIVLILSNQKEQTYVDLEDYRLFKSILHNADLEGRNLAQLKRIEVEQLKSLIKEKATFASISAKNIVEFLYGNVVKYYPALPVIEEGSANQKYDTRQEVIEVNHNATLLAYPNPSVNWANLDYVLPTGISEGLISITSSTDRRIESIEIKENKGTIDLNIENWSNVIYFATIHFGAENQSPLLNLIISK